jgi:hypothetical protein
MHDWQNTGYQKQQFSQESASSGSCLLPPDKQSECPLQCGHLETPFHYMQCFSTILSDARQLGIEQLEKSLYKMKTSPPLLEAILQGILCWETSTEYDLTAESHPLLFDIPHQQLLHKQNLIGWEKILKGFVSKDWGVLQGQYYRQQHLTNNRKYMKSAWLHNLLLQLHYYRNGIWKVRNDTLHGGSTKEQKQLARSQLLQEVKALYRKNRRHIPLQERALFHLPLRFRLKQGQQQLQLWIKRAQLMFTKYDEIPISTDQTNRITDWLSQWDLGDAVIAHDATLSSVPVSRLRVDSSDSEASEPRLPMSQSDISNWLKSWGHNEDKTTQVTHHNKQMTSVIQQESPTTEYSELK